MSISHWRLIKSLYYTKHEEYYTVRALNCNLNIHPWSLIWNWKINPWKRRFLLDFPSFSGSMLNFQGVLFFPYISYIPYIAMCKPYQGKPPVKSKRCANDVRCWKLTWRVTGQSHVVVLWIMMPMMLMLMDNGWILLGICKKHVCCFQFPISFHFGWRPQFYVLFCVPFVLFYRYCWWKKSQTTTFWMFLRPCK